MKLSYAGRLFRELLAFAWANKLYWLVPLVLLLALTIFLIATSGAAAPFVYTLF
jgi:hypothetical protein